MCTMWMLLHISVDLNGERDISDKTRSERQSTLNENILKYRLLNWIYVKSVICTTVCEHLKRIGNFVSSWAFAWETSSASEVVFYFLPWMPNLHPTVTWWKMGFTSQEKTKNDSGYQNEKPVTTPERRHPTSPLSTETLSLWLLEYERCRLLENRTIITDVYWFQYDRVKNELRQNISYFVKIKGIYFKQNNAMTHCKTKVVKMWGRASFKSTLLTRFNTYLFPFVLFTIKGRVFRKKMDFFKGKNSDIFGFGQKNKRKKKNRKFALKMNVIIFIFF